jgi:hypothetical protein
MQLIIFVNERCANKSKTNDGCKIVEYEFEKHDVTGSG